MRTSFTFLILAACGSGGGDDAVDARAVSDGAAGVDAVETADAPPAGGPGGVVSLTRLPGGLNMDGAYFVAERAADDPCRNASRREGDCCAWPPDFEQPPGPAPSFRSAGTITIEDTSSGDRFPTLEPGPDGSYFGYQWTDPTWTAGDTLRATATGSDAIGAFTIDVTAPASITGLTPTWDDDHPLTIDHAQDLTLTWTSDGAGGTMSVTLLAEQNGGGFPSHGAVFCEVPEADGTLTVPQALLSTFPSGDLCAVCGLTRTVTGHTTSGSNASFSVSVTGGGGGTFE